jgi:hypothetical protein
VCVGGMRACKPNLVYLWRPGGLRREVIIYLERPSPAVSSGLPAPSLDDVERNRRITSTSSDRITEPRWNGATWPYTPWGLPGRSRRRERRCALTAPFHPLPRRPGRRAGLLSVARAICTEPTVSGADAVFPLGSTAPCGVRTFLTADADKRRPRRSDDPTRTSPLCTPERPTKFGGPAVEKAQRPRRPSALIKG